jgi:pteridine reductase
LNPPNKQEAKVALVTGGSRRIGAALVKKLHAFGYKVVIHCHQTINEAHKLAQSLNEYRSNTALVLQKDLTLPYAAEELVTAMTHWAGRLDLLVNNASVFIRTQPRAPAFNEWDVLFNTNVKAPFLLSVAARPLLAKHLGSIINVTDIHAQKPLLGYSIYCQTKAALEMQTKSLACEFAPEIRVNALAPGAIAWPEKDNSLTSAQKHQIIAKTPLKRHGDPEFIAQALLTLAENPFITGQVLNVDGGKSVGH